jgi:rubrerythrin
MSEDKTTDILKSAILMEKRGQAFYEKVAKKGGRLFMKKWLSKHPEPS